jgi:hypothetical protein
MPDNSTAIFSKKKKRKELLVMLSTGLASEESCLDYAERVCVPILILIENCYILY